MTKEEHRKLGIEYFNKTWDYIDKQDRTEEDDLMMMNYTHASRLHWTLSEAPLLNIVRGEWQISHVYALLGMGESALKHAEFVHKHTLDQGFGDFDLVFAHECMAYAYKVLGDLEKMNHYLDLGYASIDQCEKQGDKDYCKSQLDLIKK